LVREFDPDRRSWLWLSTAPIFTAATIPGSGAQQATGLNASPAQAATTCAANSPVSGEVTITAQLAVAHGITPGLTYSLGSFPSPFSTTYTALPGTTGTTLIGEAVINGGACTGFSGEGTALSGTGGAFTFPTISTTNPLLNGGTGITTKNGQKLCGMIGEYGDDSPFPGAQFLEMVDDKGNPLPGSSALVPIPNQGTANFTGWTTIGSATLNVTGMNSYTITTGVSYNTTMAM